MNCIKHRQMPVFDELNENISPNVQANVNIAKPKSTLTANIVSHGDDSSAVVLNMQKRQFYLLF